MSVHRFYCALLIVEPSLNFSVRCVLQGPPPPGQDSPENSVRDQVVRHVPKKQPCESQISHVEFYKRLVAKGMYNSRKVSNIKAKSQGSLIETIGARIRGQWPRKVFLHYLWNYVLRRRRVHFDFKSIQCVQPCAIFIAGPLHTVLGLLCFVVVLYNLNCQCADPHHLQRDFVFLFLYLTVLLSLTQPYVTTVYAPAFPFVSRKGFGECTRYTPGFGV